MQDSSRSRAMLLMAAVLLFVGAGWTDAAAQDRVYDISELTTQPSLESPRSAAAAIDRSYPRRLRSQQVTGTVQLSFVVLTDGSVDAETIEVLQTDVERLGEAARRAVARIRFNPGRVDGTAVPTRVQLPIVYRAGR